MGRLVSLSFTVVTMAAVWMVTSANSANTGGAEFSVGAILPRVGVAFQMKSPELRGACTVTRGAKVSRGLYALKVDPACSTLLPGIERVRRWHERSDGSVEFIGEGGDTLAAFGMGDGVDYESFRPRSPMLTLKQSG